MLMPFGISGINLITGFTGRLYVSLWDHDAWGGGGGDPSGLTLGLTPIGPVDLCMQKQNILKKF